MEHDQLYTSGKNMDTVNQTVVNVKKCEREKKRSEQQGT